MEGEAGRGRCGWRGRPVEVGTGRSRRRRRGFEVHRAAEPVRKRLWRRFVGSGRVHRRRQGGYASVHSGGGTLATVARGYPSGGSGTQGGDGGVGFSMNSTSLGFPGTMNKNVISECLRRLLGPDGQVGQDFSRTNFVR